MKKLIFLLLLGLTLDLSAQTKLSPTETMDLVYKTNNMYCTTLDVIIRCMFEYDETKFQASLDTLKLVIQNYQKIENAGTFEGRNRLVKQRCSTNLWSAFSLMFDKEEYKNGERKQKVTYAGFDRKIPKKLKKQFDRLEEIQDFVCTSNLY